MRILITGVTGFVGRNLAYYWLYQTDLMIVGTGRSLERPAHLPEAIHYIPLQLTDAVAVMQAIAAFKPDVVIHSAAMSKPNDCEVEQQLCYEVNVNATRYVVEACRQTGSRLVYMSTDFVFGDHGPFAEDDNYDPVNYYGHSKVLAEAIVKESELDWSIVRTVLVYGKQLPGLSPTFPQWVKLNLDQGKSIRVFTDQYRTPTYVPDLVNGINAIVKQEAAGIFHLCGAETFTPFDIAQRIVSHFGLNASLVQPVTRLEFAEKARRPIRSTLHIHKAASELGFVPRSLADVLPDLF
jgi:dTDP-4-dehydrorhamnose reductase